MLLKQIDLRIQRRYVQCLVRIRATKITVPSDDLVAEDEAIPKCCRHRLGQAAVLLVLIEPIEREEQAWVDFRTQILDCSRGLVPVCGEAPIWDFQNSGPQVGPRTEGRSTPVRAFRSAARSSECTPTAATIVGGTECIVIIGSLLFRAQQLRSTPGRCVIGENLLPATPDHAGRRLMTCTPVLEPLGQRNRCAPMMPLPLVRAAKALQIDRSRTLKPTLITVPSGVWFAAKLTEPPPSRGPCSESSS
jgi:hypothetical protein